MSVVPLARDPERFVTARELAGILHVGERTIARWVAEGMPSETWGLRARRFLPSECLEWARHRSEAA